MLDSSRVSLVVVQWTTVAWVVCSFLFALLPSVAYPMMSTSFHMLNVRDVIDPRLTVGGFLVGLIVWDVIAYLGAQLFVWLWNRSGSQKA
jgi:hypothetical protein